MKLLIKSIVVIIFAVLFIFLPEYYSEYINNSSEPDKKISYMKKLNDCNNYTDGCTFSGEKRQIKIKFIGEVRTMKSFSISTKFENFNRTIDNVSVTFKMKSMDMGLNKFSLNKQDISSGISELWLGNILLPICVSKRSDWEMQLNIETEKNIYLVDDSIVIH